VFLFVCVYFIVPLYTVHKGSAITFLHLERAYIAFCTYEYPLAVLQAV